MADVVIPSMLPRCDVPSVAPCMLAGVSQPITAAFLWIRAGGVFRFGPSVFRPTPLPHSCGHCVRVHLSSPIYI